MINVFRNISQIAEQFSERPALIDEAGHRISYAELLKNVADISDQLAQIGIGEADRVGLVAENTPLGVALLLSIMRLGALPALVDARTTWADYETRMEIATPAFVLFAMDFSQPTKALAGRTGADALKCQLGRFGVLKTDYVPPALPGVALLVFTSGVTAFPKAVMLSELAVQTSVIDVQRLCLIGSEDRIYLGARMTHRTGLTAVLAALMNGAALRLETRIKPERILSAIRGGVSILLATPAWLSELSRYSKSCGGGRVENDLREIICAAAPLAPSLSNDCAEMFGIVPRGGYGLTEAGNLVCLAQSDDDELTYRVFGRDVEIKIGEGGEICLRGPGLMKGYLGDPETSKAVLRDGWLHTRDIGSLRENGELRLAGRRQYIVDRGEGMIPYFDIKSVLAEHPSVRHVMILPPPASRKELVAFIEISQGDPVTAEDIRAHAESRLKPAWCPDRYFITTDLPKTVTGKVLAEELQSAFGHARDTQVGAAEAS